jgi:hypothetical protein
MTPEEKAMFDRSVDSVRQLKTALDNLKVAS